jgi:hypothetical protein
MDRSPEEELAKLGEKLRKTLSMRAQSESMMTEDVNRGMSHMLLFVYTRHNHNM